MRQLLAITPMALLAVMTALAGVAPAKELITPERFEECAATVERSDLMEFGEVEDANVFGWSALPGSVLSSITPGHVGEHALRVQAGDKPQDYMGIGLRRDIDLTGAAPGNTISFFIKQNFGRSICVNVQTVYGNVVRYIDVKRGEWTHVILDLDLAQWQQGEKDSVVAWSQVNYLHIYSKAFDATGEEMLIDGFAISVDGESGTTLLGAITRWDVPYETDAAWYIGNTQAVWAISKITGRVLGGWNAMARKRCLISMEDRYHLEDRKSLVTGRESDDRVIEATFVEREQRVELTCSNPDTPDLIIRKRYWPDGNKLFHRIALKTRSSDLQFVTYNSQAQFTKTYRDAGYYMGGGDGGWPLVPAPMISKWKKVTAYRNTTKGMVLHQQSACFSFAHIRTRLDNNFVWPWYTGAIASYCERRNILHYTPDGWDMSLGTSKLHETKETTYEQYITIFEGDWQTFLTEEYPALAEVQKAYNEIPPTPEWVASIIADTSCDMNRIRQIVEMTDEGFITVLVDMGASWADYYVDDSLMGGYGGHITAEELKDFIQRIKALSPRVKVGIYMWQLSTSADTRIYGTHPEWFRTTTKDGELCTTFPGVMLNYAQLLSIPEAYDALLAQFDLVLSYLDTDFIYLDDPKAINPVDWESGEYTRDDLSFKFFLDIKRIAAKHGPDKVVFFNNMSNPYADINYIEARGELGANNWRHFAGNIAIIETSLNQQPEARAELLYYVTPHEREYVNRTLAAGFIPSLNYGNPIARRPFIQAAYEIGNCRQVPMRYTPDWKSDKKTQLESYAVQRNSDTGYILSLIDHAEEARTVPVGIELDNLDLNRDGQVFVWKYTVENANTFKGIATADVTREVYRGSGWQLDRATERQLLYAGPYRRQLQFDIEMDPLLLYQLYITDQPVAVYSENELPANYMFNQTRNVTLVSKYDWDRGTIAADIESSRAEAEVILFIPLSRNRISNITLDGKQVASILKWETGDVFPIVRVGLGRHSLQVEFETLNTIETVSLGTMALTQTTNRATVRLPGHKKAIFTIESEGKLLFGGEAVGIDGKFTLPLPSVRDAVNHGRLSVKGVVDHDGKVSLVESQSVPLSLSAALPRLGSTFVKKPELVAGVRKLVDVNRVVNGVNVLRSCIITSDSLRGFFQPHLKALTADIEVDKLLMMAGSTRKIDNYTCGAAFAGLEIKDLRKVRVSLSNTFHSAHHNRGKGKHIPPKNNSRNFAGVVIDYHTAEGYAKRLRLATGVIHPKCSSVYPNYGTLGEAHAIIDLGAELIESPETIFSIDLEKYAPLDWDGQVWLFVGSDWVAADRRLTLQILAVNEDVQDGFISGVDPTAYKIEYDKPKMLIARRYPGGILIDGQTNEEWWKEAEKTRRFYILGGHGISEADTTAMMLYDDDNLYVAFTCMEPVRTKPLIKGGAAYDDDEIEIFIDVKGEGEGKKYTQFIVNAANEQMEYNEKGPTDNLGATSAVYVEKGSWSVEMTIPFKGIGVEPPRPGDEWKISLCRYRPPGRGVNTELIVWAPLKSAGFSIKDVANFGTLLFK